MNLSEGGLSQTRVMAEAFDFEKTSVGLKADLPQVGQVTQPFADGEVARMVEGGFGASPREGLAGNFLVVLLDLGALGVEVQRRRDPFGDHPRAKGAGVDLVTRRLTMSGTWSGRPRSRFSRITG